MTLNSVQLEFLVSPTLILSLLSALPEQGSRSLSRCTMWDANGGSPSSGLQVYLTHAFLVLSSGSFTGFT